jgi:hypothetical protein
MTAAPSGSVESAQVLAQKALRIIHAPQSTSRQRCRAASPPITAAFGNDADRVQAGLLRRIKFYPAAVFDWTRAPLAETGA